MRAKTRIPARGGLRAGHRKWPAEVRLQVAQAVVDRATPAATVGQAFGIPVTTVMDWVHRYKRYGADATAWWSEEVKRRKQASESARGVDPRRAAVVESRRQHPEHGTRRIRDLMARFEGLGVSETTVRRILHEEGLLETVPEATAKPGPPAHRFERAEPNQLWQSDIFTFLLRRHQRLYVTAFMDDYSRYVVSLVVAHHQRSTLVLEALSRGIAEYGAPKEVLTDQGRQYVAWRGHTDFEGELRRQGIRHIKSRPHHPQTLGKIERFWKTLWEEFLSRTVCADFDDCQRRLALFVQAYNFRRPHQGIAGAVPADRFFRAAPQVRQAIEQGVADNAMALAQARPQRKPFYLVGRFGDRDLSIALSGKGLMVRLGDVEQTIPLGREEDDDETSTSRRFAEASSAADPEVALEVGGDRPDRASALPDGAERALGREAGERRDLGGGDLAGNLLPARDPRAERDAAGAGPSGQRGRQRNESGAPDCGPGGEGEGARASEAALAAAAPDDAAGDEGAGGENQLDEEWQRSFAEIEDEGAGGEAADFDPGSDWRGRAVTWERKLAGADEASHGQEDLYPDAGSATGTGGTVPDDDGGPFGGADRERGGAAAGTVAESLSEPDASGFGVADPGAGRAPEWTSGPAREGEEPARGGEETAAGEREAAPARGNDRPDPGSGERPASGTERSRSAT
jgi:transposase InsO family protein